MNDGVGRTVVVQLEQRIQKMLRADAIIVESQVVFIIKNFTTKRIKLKFYKNFKKKRNECNLK